MSKTKLNYNDPTLLTEVEGLARDGYDDFQIAEVLGVTAGTFSRNKRKKQANGQQSPLSLALRRGRRPLEVLVENSLFKRATGQTIKTVTSRFILNPDGSESDRRLVTETVEEIPPDVRACELWLRNRKPEVWNSTYRIDKTTNGESITDTTPIIKIEHVQISSSQITPTVKDVGF